MSIINRFPAGGGGAVPIDSHVTLLANGWTMRSEEVWDTYYQNVTIPEMTASANIEVGLDVENLPPVNPAEPLDAAAKAQLVCSQQFAGGIRISTLSSAVPTVDIPVLVRIFE